MLSQLMEDGNDRPIAYFRRKLLPREEKYSTVEKVQMFYPYLMGRTFTIEMDHQSLKWLNTSNPRLTRWSLLLQSYSFIVKYRTGCYNRKADGLSRLLNNAGEGGRSVVT